MEEAVEYINNRDVPLALYVFTNSSKIFQSILNKTSTGSISAMISYKMQVLVILKYILLKEKYHWCIEILV